MIKGFLFDLDGVFYTSDRILNGANETIAWLIENKIPYKFITNTTTLSRNQITNKLLGLGLNINKREVISANYAGVLYLKKIQPKSCKLILKAEAKEDYKDFYIDNKNPEVIIIGDIGKEWNFDLMNELLNDVLNGSKIIALHKGKYFKTDEGLIIDTGAFITGLEYATQTSAHVIGKPSKSFFKLAANDLKISDEKIGMVGDDLYNDIQGANNLGFFSILVKTGKHKESLVKKSDIKPNLIINSISELPKAMKEYIK